MRELNECTQEVFRRSEQRIKERRRNRNRALAVCVPVCLAAAVWAAAVFPSAVVFPSMATEWETVNGAPAGGEAAGNAPGLACPYTAVEIQAAGMFPAEHDGKVTDRLAVAELFDAVNSFFADADGNYRDGSENVQASESFPSDADNAGDCQSEPASANRWKDCTITFTAEDGSQDVFHLSGNTLMNETTNEAVFLSDGQTAELMAVLGLFA